MARTSLDTNILIYAVDPTAGDKNRIAKQVLRSAAEGEGVLTQKVTGEFLNVSRRMPHLDQPRLRGIAANLYETFPFPDHLFQAFDRSMRFQLRFRDALIATVCLAHGGSHLISADLQDGLGLDGITVLNPFFPHNGPALARLLNNG